VVRKRPAQRLANCRFNFISSLMISCALISFFSQLSTMPQLTAVENAAF
jgi:hypothetical protein